ncbi:MAG: HNH endonuclease, partial [Planctomycetota bacterium]
PARLSRSGENGSSTNAWLVSKTDRGAGDLGLFPPEIIVEIKAHVKVAVWQRDGGKCVRCGAADYLEFDHIIPFSKGGASTENNVQLLCRRCNLKKGDELV